MSQQAKYGLYSVTLGWTTPALEKVEGKVEEASFTV